MLFKLELAQKVIEQRKTQTRRLVKAGDCIYQDHPFYPNRTIVISENGRVRWEVGRDYAVQNGRGKPTLQYVMLRTIDGPQYQIVNESNGDLLRARAKPARIKLIDIQRDDVRNIDPGAAIWEGFSSQLDFLKTWCLINDPCVRFTASDKGKSWITVTKCLGLIRGSREQDDDQLWETIRSRPLKFYDAWSLTFQLVR